VVTETRAYVEIIESERGWGSKVDETLEFSGPTAEADAKKYVTDYNAKYNAEPIVPDWYMAAVYTGTRQVTVK